MNISTDGYSQITESIQQMNALLKTIATAEVGLEDKMMKMNVVASVTGLGEKIDTTR